MRAQKIFFGPLESRLLFALEEQGLSVFSFRDAMRLLRASNDATKNVLYRLKRKKRIQEILKGKYLFVPARAGIEGQWTEDVYLVLSKIMKPDYYVGFWTALNYWGMTEQIPNTVFVAITSRATDFEFGSQKIKFITLAKNRFTGLISQQTKWGEFNISSKEKTIIDCLLFPQYCGGLTEAAKALWNARKELNWNLLLGLIEKIGVGTPRRRLGFLLEQLNLQEDVQRRLQEPLKGFAWADPSRQKKVLAYDKKWGLKVNVDKQALTHWMET